MKKTIKATLMTVLLMGGLVAATGPATDSELHFALSKSAPAADASEEAVSEIRL
jgi:hypothetical protein